MCIYSILPQVFTVVLRGLIKICIISIQITWFKFNTNLCIPNFKGSITKSRNDSNSNSQNIRTYVVRKNISDHFSVSRQVNKKEISTETKKKLLSPIFFTKKKKKKYNKKYFLHQNQTSKSIKNTKNTRL